MKTPSVSAGDEVRQGAIMVVFDDTAVGILDGRSKVIDAGSVYKLRSVSQEPASKIRVDGKWRKLDGMLRLTPFEGDKFLLVKPADVRIYAGHFPDWRLEMFLVEHGYQANVYHGLQARFALCRDFGGNHPISDLCELLTKRVGRFLDGFRRRL